MGLVDGILNAESLSESSKAQYLEKLATITKHLGKTVDWIIDHPAQVVHALRQRYPTNALTQRAFVVAIKAVFIHNKDLKVSKADQFQQYSEYQNEMSQAVTERYLAAEPSEKERRNWVPWRDVLAKERELAAREFGSTEHLLLAMYCLIEPLRQDYGKLRVLVEREPPEGSAGNYLVINPECTRGKLVLNTYKTAKSYGRYERDLPPNLLAVIKASLLAQPRAYLFVDDSGQPYRIKNSFTKFSNRILQRIFGKNFTVSLMRHSHISNIDFNASTPGELIEKSKNMAHSLHMQQMYRRRVDPLPPLQIIKQMPAPASPPAVPRPSGGGVTTGANGERYVTLGL